jgi:hypothetical protein
MARPSSNAETRRRVVFGVRVAAHQQSNALRAHGETFAYNRKWRPVPKTTDGPGVNSKQVRVGSSGARPEEERAAEVESDLEHDAWPCHAHEPEQPLDLLALLHDSDLRVGERIRLVERHVWRDSADATQLYHGCNVAMDVGGNRLYRPLN